MALRNRQLAALRARRVPAWWSDAKLGIFVHWTPASVPGVRARRRRDRRAPAVGPTRRALAVAVLRVVRELAAVPRQPGGRASPRDLRGSPVRDLRREWEAGLEQWDPHAWAARFAATGARYVVFVTKHHDGYCLWPTEVAEPAPARLELPRDVVGELAEAVRGAGMRFGVYYSGGLDWRFNDRPIGLSWPSALPSRAATTPRTPRPRCASSSTRYQPSVLWNDIAWPAERKHAAVAVPDYYAAVPDGVVNDRWLPGPAWALVRTKRCAG